MIRLFSNAICAIATGFIASIPIAAASAEPLKLTDVLEATHVHGLAVDADDSNRLLIAAHHGLFALDLASGMAEPISETRDDFMGFTLHPTDPVLYASGHPAAGGNLGIIVSKDGGRTWTSLSPGLNGPVDFHQMDVSRADPKIIYGAHGGLQVSRDGGTTWERVGPLPEGLIDFAASAASADTLYAGTETGIMVSRDGGRSWQPSDPTGQPVTMVHVSAGGIVHAFALEGNLLTAREETLQWRRVGAAPADAIILHLAVDPADPSRLYAATYQGDLLASEDGGKSWRSLRTP